MQVRELNQFYDYRKQIFYSREAFTNAFMDQDDEVSKNSILGMADKVDKLDYLPKGPRVWEEDGVTYGNSYVESGMKGTPGDVTPWISHFEALGWGENADHVLDWMAYTVQHPERKINHMILLGGGEGIGKDFILYPLTLAMGRNAKVIDGTMLLSNFNDYLFGTKYLHINETELGDHRDATTISNKLKPLATAPPLTLPVNPKGTKCIYVRNIVNCTMTTNSLMPFKAQAMSRRFYALWSDLNMRDTTGNMKPEWETYWDEMWKWMEHGGTEACIHHLETRDLSNFRPQAAPPVTEFLNEIVNRSKPATHQTIEALVNNSVGAFGADIVTTEDLMRSIRTAEQFNPEFLYTNAGYFNPQKVGMVLKMMGYKKIRARSGGRDIYIWVLRDYVRYANIPAGDLLAVYDSQINNYKDKGLKAI